MNKIVQDPQLKPIYFPKDKQNTLHAVDGREIITAKSKVKSADGSVCDGYKQEYSYNQAKLTMFAHQNMERGEVATRSIKNIAPTITILQYKEKQKASEIKQLRDNITQHMESLTAQRKEFLQKADDYLAGALEGKGSMTKLILDTLNGHKEDLDKLQAELEEKQGKI